MFTQYLPTNYQHIALVDGIGITIKRIDQVHPYISGNKWYKLKYNLLEAKRLGYTHLLSFGGAYSNHIYALAHAAKEYGFACIGIIRGEELADKPLNPTLTKAQELGMDLQFISRQEYRSKHTPEFMSKLQTHYPSAYIIPEGGTNALAIKGCKEILSKHDQNNYDVIVCAVGTGGTFSGLINASSEQQKLLGFAALKGDFLTAEVQKWTDKDKQNWTIYEDDMFAGYGKFNDKLLNFIANIKAQYDLPLEPIYTGKAFYRLLAMIEQGKIAADSQILFIHTGGLQAFLPY
ncbi:1-aminocyclopropane-1-carboxylate deaminase/D-cysteine desulfhydrase [Psychrobacter sp. I-STPA10]|uniref:1-aminocyclopropane-1-carboxylate deaminase/D-cysteine desulfhydrase n=1 Tax=Psychrobacter sp. I-STPA10 TaxID=2585769 RepID=UPI001E320392|nr:pyridoxal-phosphate dependent enzyme [Psychrobacter sp. I-STPA10]